MKKLIFALAIAFSFAIVSCGTKSVESEVETEIVVDEVDEATEGGGGVATEDGVIDGTERDETPVVE